MRSAPKPSDTPVRYPLVVEDRSKDPDVYGSGWLRLVYPDEIADLRLSADLRVWDSAGRPVEVFGGVPELTDLAADPQAREALLAWRRRVPVPLMAAGTGDTAIQFVVSDVAAAQSRLTEKGATRQPGLAQRLLPIVLMVVSAIALIPLLRIESWGIGVVVVLYTVSSALMHRWSYPPGWWGNPPRRDEPDRIARLAMLSKVIFWSVAAAAVTLVALDMMGLRQEFVPWV